MIDEDVLRELLDHAARDAPAPGRSPEALLDDVVRSGATAVARRPSGRVLLVAAALVVAVASVVAFAATRSSGPSRTSSAAGAFAPSTTIVAESPTSGTFDPGQPASAGGAGAAGPGAAGPGAIASGSAAALPPATPAPALPAPAPMVDTARVVKTGSLDLEVRTKAFAPAVERITAIAVGLGGYVVESTTTEADKVPRGSITLRVPVGAFEQLVADVRKLGDVKAVTTKGTDVTAQFTDLDARLTALTATRDRLYEVLRAARNIGDIIAVQDRITGVQTEIEQLQGQQRLLNDQASFGTLAVTLAEPGGDQLQATGPRDAGFRHAFAVARHRFADSLQSLIAGTGAAAVPVMILAALAVVGRIVWRRERRRLI